MVFLLVKVKHRPFLISPPSHQECNILSVNNSGFMKTPLILYSKLLEIHSFQLKSKIQMSFLTFWKFSQNSNNSMEMKWRFILRFQWTLNQEKQLTLILSMVSSLEIHKLEMLSLRLWSSQLMLLPQKNQRSSLTWILKLTLTSPWRTLFSGHQLKKFSLKTLLFHMTWL